MNVEAALKEYRPLVRRIAVTMVAKCPPNVELDDLIQEGMMGLYESVGRFNSEAGVQFTTFATHRIRGAMLDHLRKEDTLFRSERRAVREGRLEDPGTKAPSQYDENGDWVDLDFIAPKSWEPLHRLEQSRRFQAACRVFDSLSDRNRSIVRMFMIEHAGTGAIAKAFGITESAVSLIGRTYLLALEKALASH